MEIARLRQRVIELKAENRRYRQLIPDLQAAEAVERLFRSLQALEAEREPRVGLRNTVIAQLAAQPAAALRAHEDFMRWYSGPFRERLDALGMLKHPLMEKVSSKK